MIKPGWLPASVDQIWSDIVRDLAEANVPLQQIDAHAIGMYCLVILEAVKAAERGDARAAARLGRDGLQWAGILGASPAGRARLNIKPPLVKDADWERWEKLRRL